MAHIGLSIRLSTVIGELTRSRPSSRLSLAQALGCVLTRHPLRPYAQASAVIRMKRNTIGLARCRLFSPSLGKPSATATRLMEGISPFLEQRTYLWFIHKWSCIIEILFLYLSLQLAYIEARMGVGGFQYSQTIYFKTEGEVTTKN